MKKAVIFILTIIFLLSFASCTAKKKDLHVLTLKGPTGIGMVKLIEDNPNYTVDIASAPEEVTAAVIKGEFDIAAVPINLAATLYKKTNGAIKIAAINTLGVLYILENGNTISSLSDLDGKKIYATGQGATPEYILKALFKENNINCEIEFLTEHAALATKMISGDIILGMLPEPNVTAALSGNDKLRIAINLTEEFEKTFNYKLAQGCIIVNTEFAKNNKNALDDFLKEYKASVDFVNTKVDEAAALCEKYEIIPKAALAKKAIPNCNIVFIDGDEMKTMSNNIFKMLFDANPQSIGGSIPDEAIYR